MIYPYWDNRNWKLITDSESTTIQKKISSYFSMGVPKMSANSTFETSQSYLMHTTLYKQAILLLACLIIE